LDTRETANRSHSRAGKVFTWLAKARSGHFVAEGQINGHDVLFLVDTGATDVAISDKTARKMGVEFGPQITVMTAAGKQKQHGMIR
jgi:aspartyl protease family protein